MILEKQHVSIHTTTDKQKIEFGSKVSISEKYKRTRLDNRKKVYTRNEFASTGIFLGYRTITNGHTMIDCDTSVWIVDEYIRVALVAINTKDNAIYVPINCIEIMDENNE